MTRRELVVGAAALAVSASCQRGWSSFWAPLAKAVIVKKDISLGMLRQAVSCRRCGGHLGHVFDDGPKPAGLRYCINGVALTFKPVAG